MEDAAVWYEVWCEECTRYLCDGDAMPRDDAQNVAQRHEDTYHGGATCCLVSLEVV